MYSGEQALNSSPLLQSNTHSSRFIVAIVSKLKTIHARSVEFTGNQETSNKAVCMRCYTILALSVMIMLLIECETSEYNLLLKGQ